MIKFNKYNVTDDSTGIKSRVHYSLDNRTDMRRCVTLYAKDYDDSLAMLFPGSFHNNSDMMTDYFERTRVVIFENDPLYSQARTAANRTNH